MVVAGESWKKTVAPPSLQNGDSFILMGDGICESGRTQAPSLSGETPSLQGERCWDVALGQISLPSRLVSLVDNLGAALAPISGDFTNTQFPSTNHASSSDTGSGLQAGKSGVLRTSLPCPFPAATLALGCLTLLRLLA